MPTPPANLQTVFRRSLTNGSDMSVSVNINNTPNTLSSRHKDELATKLMQSVIDKLVRDPKIDENRSIDSGEFEMNVQMNTLQETINDTILSKKEAQNQIDALPNLGLTKDIIISSVLSPNDMMSTELTYTVSSDIFDDVESELTQIVKDYFENDYDIKAKLPRWLEISLFMEGAAPLCVIPESSVDHAINSHLKISNEMIKAEIQNGEVRSYGVLGTPRYLNMLNEKRNRSGMVRTTFSTESFSASENASYNAIIGGNNDAFGIGISVVDNPNLLKVPKLNEKMRKDRLNDVYSVNNFGLESHHKPWLKNSINSTNDLYPTRQTDMVPVLTLKTLDDLEKKTVGHPVVFQFPTEAVIPVYSPSDPSNHVCYFVALDEFGNPLKFDQHSDQFRNMEQNFNSSSNTSVSSSLINSAEKMGIMDTEKYSKNSFDQMKVLYSRVIEQDLIQRMDAGGFLGRDLKLGKATELHKLMFVRALNQMKTQLLFIPAELMTYVAFDYKPNGVGRSLLDKTKVIGSLRMVNAMASAIANTKMAIDHRKLAIKLDPEDPDPMKRVTQYMHEYQRATKASFPIGVNSFTDIVDYLQRAGVQVEISGHEGMPDMSMEVSNQRYDYNKPDEAYAQELDKQHIMGLGAPPEAVRSTEDIQFATQIISGHVFYAKISQWRQEVFCGCVSDHLQKYTRNSQPLMTALTEVIKNNRDKLIKIPKNISDEAIAIVYANNISVSLPKPDVAQTQMQSDSLDKYEQLLEKALPSFISPDLFPSLNIGEKGAETMEHINKVIKAIYMRDWLMKNNVLPELFDMVNDTEDSASRFEMLTKHGAYADSFSPVLRDYILNSAKRSKQNDGIIEKGESLLGAEQGDAGVSGGFDSSSSNMDNGGNNDDFGMGMDSDGGNDAGDDVAGNDDDAGGADDFGF